MTTEAHEDDIPDVGDARGLSAPVRARLVHLTAHVLPAVGVVPPALRKVASFAPQRRARLGGAQIVAALADADFRSRVVTQLAGSGEIGALVTALRGGDGDPARADASIEHDPGAQLGEHDPLDVAALAWLARPAGWREILDAARVRHDEAQHAADAVDADRVRARLERDVEILTHDLDQLRSQHKESSDELRAENTLLRQRLGEARAATRLARSEADDARARLQEAAEHAEAGTSAAATLERRLRKQIVELQASVSSQRAEQRSDRDEASQRARMLLDTVVDAAQGLQRELGLPPAEGSLAERYEAQVESADGARLTSAAGVLGAGSPVLLEQLLSMPRARLIIDGYNVTKQAWASSSLEVQRLRLVNGLAPVVARSGAEVTVVFDAAASPTRPVVAAPRGVRVMFSPENVIADDVIRDLVALEPTGRVVIVVTSDQAVARDVRRNGARVMDSVALAGLLAR